MSGIDLMIIMCPPRVAKSLADELEDKIAELHSQARIVKYGVMCKGQHGFIVFGCPYPDGFPTIFYDTIQKDKEITGYVLVPSDNPSQEPQQPEEEAQP